MSEEMKLRMDAYYYGFTFTGVREIDLILSAVACAGKAYHHTDNWSEETTAYDGHEGATPVDWIQNAADKAAAAWNRRPTPDPEAVARAVDAIFADIGDRKGFEFHDIDDETREEMRQSCIRAAIAAMEGR